MYPSRGSWPHSTHVCCAAKNLGADTLQVSERSCHLYHSERQRLSTPLNGELQFRPGLRLQKQPGRKMEGWMAKHRATSGLTCAHTPRGGMDEGAARWNWCCGRSRVRALSMSRLPYQSCRGTGRCNFIFKTREQGRRSVGFFGRSHCSQADWIRGALGPLSTGLARPS